MLVRVYARCVVAVWCLVAISLGVMPPTTAAGQDADQPAAKGENGSTFLLVATTADDDTFVVLADSSKDVPATLSAVREAGRRVELPQLTLHLRALKQAAGNAATVVLRMDAGTSTTATPVLQVLAACARKDVRIGRLILVCGDDPANVRDVREVRIDSSGTAPIGTVQHFRFRGVEGVETAYSISPEPINEFYRTITWPGDRPMSSSPAFVFWQLESQLRRGSSMIGNRISMRFAADVPADAMMRGLDLIERINDGADPRDIKHLALEAPLTPDAVIEADGGNSAGDVPARHLPTIRPGANAVSHFHPRSVHTLVLVPQSVEEPPSAPIANPAAPVVAEPMDISRAIMHGLKWLRDHQNDDGSWSPDTFSAAGEAHGRDRGQYQNVDGTPDTGWPSMRVALTGLSLLAYFAAGNTHTQGEYANTVKKALRYLKYCQNHDGSFGDGAVEPEHADEPQILYTHAICTAAMAEAYAMTGSNMLKGPAQKGMDLLLRDQTRIGQRRGGWRLGTHPGVSDTCTTGWVVLALQAAREGSLDVPVEMREGVINHLDDMTLASGGTWKTGYFTAGGAVLRLSGRGRFVPQPTCDAINVLARMFDTRGAAHDEPMLKSQAGTIALLDNRPSLRNPDRLDFIYWHWASLALFQMGGQWWSDWEPAMNNALARCQDQAEVASSRPVHPREAVGRLHIVTRGQVSRRHARHQPFTRCREHVVHEPLCRRPVWRASDHGNCVGNRQSAGNHHHRHRLLLGLRAKHIIGIGDAPHGAAVGHGIHHLRVSAPRNHAALSQRAQPLRRRVVLALEQRRAVRGRGARLRIGHCQLRHAVRRVQCVQRGRQIVQMPRHAFGPCGAIGATYQHAQPQRQHRPHAVRVAHLFRVRSRLGAVVGGQHAFALQPDRLARFRGPPHIGPRVGAFGQQPIGQPHGFLQLAVGQQLHPRVAGNRLELARHLPRHWLIHRRVDHYHPVAIAGGCGGWRAPHQPRAQRERRNGTQQAERPGLDSRNRVVACIVTCAGAQCGESGCGRTGLPAAVRST